MTGYFDDAQRHASVSLHEAVMAEERVIKDVSLVVGDREFPDDLRQKMLHVIEQKSISLVVGRAAMEDYIASGSSQMIADLHSLFHVLADRRIEFRFGSPMDKPDLFLMLRDEHDNEA